jgi:putative transcriptional regulator
MTRFLMANLVTRRLLVIVAIAAISALASRTPVGALDRVGDGESLSGRLIVAASEMPENPFSRTVILMIDHDAEGAFGLVLNRPIAEGPVGAVLEDLGAAEAFSEGVRAATAPIRVMSGGPVEQSVAFLLHGGPLGATDTAVAPGLALAADLAVIDRLVALPEPPPMLLALGYSGWGPGQLEREFARGDWRLLFPDRALLLETPTNAMWREAMAKLPREL